MSVSSATNWLNLTICSYQAPEEGDIDPHEDLIVGKEADIYLIQSKISAHARIIISHLNLRGYQIYQRGESEVFVALSSRFKMEKQTFGMGNGLVSITALDYFTGVRVRASAMSGNCNLNLDVLYANDDKDSNDLVVLAAPSSRCGHFDNRYKKIFEPCDVGNLLVRTPVEELALTFKRVFHPVYRYDRVEKLCFEQFLRATFCVIHWSKQDSIV